jgi:hypothetical protein
MFSGVTYYASFWDRYLDPHKVTFDKEALIIIVNTGETDLDWQVDVYSAWKRWVLERGGQHASVPPAMRSVGGDPKPGGSLGATYFLTNGWRLRTWEGDHRLTVNGNVYTEEGDAVTLPTVDKHNTEIVFNLSAEVYAADPDLEAIRDAFWGVNKDDAAAVANSIGEYVRKQLLDKLLYMGSRD